MSMRRFAVSGHSMLPALGPGDEVVTTTSRPARPGDVVAFPQPGRPGRWLIKRLANASGRVTSDNPSDAALDSREVGPVDPGSLLTVVDRLDSATFVEACALLSAEDRSIAAAVERWGMPSFWHRPEGFPTLVLLILEQQVSLESGAAMYHRLADLVGEVEPSAVLQAGDNALRSIGVTRQKSGYLLALADTVLSGALSIPNLGKMATAEARHRLMALKGIGAWTADAYLLSAQRRPDMWPVGDRALQVGTGEVLGMDEAPDEESLELLAEPWKPIRAVAARIIWHSYLSSRGRVEPPDPTTTHIGS